MSKLIMPVSAERLTGIHAREPQTFRPVTHVNCNFMVAFFLI